MWWLAVWKFLAGIPLKTWLLLAFLAAVLAALAYAHRHGTLAERAAQEAKIAAMIRRGTEEIAKKDRRNAAAQAQAFANGQAIGDSRVRDLQDQISSYERLVADQRAGTVRLRQLWQGCVSGPQTGDAAALSGGSMPADDLRAESAARIVRVGQDADSKVKRLQEFVQVQQKLCGEVQ